MYQGLSKWLSKKFYLYLTSIKNTEIIIFLSIACNTILGKFLFERKYYEKNNFKFIYNFYSAFFK